jgi:hypothetical protein
MICGNKGQPEYTEDVYEEKVVVTEHHHYETPQQQYDPNMNHS